MRLILAINCAGLLMADESPLLPSGSPAENDFLRVAEERPLFSVTTNPERVCCRLIWQRSFHPVAVIRAEVRAKKTELHVKVLRHDPVKREYRLLRKEVRNLDDSGYAYVAGALMRNKAKLWDESSMDPDGMGVDGSIWTLELLVNGKYKVVSRWSPSEGPLYELGRVLIEQAIGGDLTPIY